MKVKFLVDEIKIFLSGTGTVLFIDLKFLDSLLVSRSSLCTIAAFRHLL
jgi:hypothetical protein